MNRPPISSLLLPALALLLSVWLATRPTVTCARQDANATIPDRKKSVDGSPKGVTNASSKHRPVRTPKRHRANSDANDSRRPAPRSVTVTIVSSLPYCDVLIDGEPEEQGTDEQGRLTILLEPGVYDVGVANPGYVTEGREVEVRASPPYRQEERFVLRRALLSLQVKTNPPAVKITLDGNREGESDADGLFTFKEVDPSVQHTLHATKEDYREETVTVAPYKREASVRLARDVLTLKVKTYPPQAEVSLDDEVKGVSDGDGVLLIPKVKTDKEHTLRALREGYVPQTATVPANYELAVIKLSPLGELPTPSVGRTSPEVPGGQGASNGRQEVRERGRSEAQTSDTSQSPGAPHPPPEEEGRPPSSQKSGHNGPPLDVEIMFWNTIKDSQNPEEFAAYLRKYPEGQFVELARIRMNRLLSNGKGELDPAATKPTPEPLPTPTAESATASASTAVPAEAPGPPEPSLEESIEGLRRHFASRFTYTYTGPRQNAGGVSITQEASIDVEPLRFDGCRIEWRVFDDIHRVSLSDLDPADIKVALRAAPETSYSTNVWSVTVVGAGGREVFTKLEGGREADAKKYWRLVLLYNNRERADELAAAFGRAIGECRNKTQR